MQTANLKVCGGEMVVSVLAVQQVTTGTTQARGIPVSHTSRHSGLGGIWNFPQQYLQCAYIHCISDGYCICRYDSLIYLSSLQVELWKLWQINVFFHHQVPLIDCKRKVYWRPKPRSVEKGSKLIGTRQMIEGRVMSWKTKMRRVEASESPVAQFSFEVGWSDLLCFCQSYTNFRSYLTWNHKITRHHWNGWIRIFTSCVLALAEFCVFWQTEFKILILNSTYSIAIIPGATGDYGRWFFRGCRPFRRTSWARGVASDWYL